MGLVVDILSLRRGVIPLPDLVSSISFSRGATVVTLWHWLLSDICQRILLRESDLLVICNPWLLVIEIWIGLLLIVEIPSESLVFR